jgi:hypothetical protein
MRMKLARARPRRAISDITPLTVELDRDRPVPRGLLGISYEPDRHRRVVAVPIAPLLELLGHIVDGTPAARFSRDRCRTRICRCGGEEWEDPMQRSGRSSPPVARVGEVTDHVAPHAEGAQNTPPA